MAKGSSSVVQIVLGFGDESGQPRGGPAVNKDVGQAGAPQVPPPAVQAQIDWLGGGFLQMPTRIFQRPGGISTQKKMLVEGQWRANDRAIYSVLNAVLLMAAERIHVRAEGGERLLYLARAFTLHLCLLFGRHGKEDALKFLERLHGFHTGIGEERLHGVRLLQCAGQRLTTKSRKGKCCAETDSFDVHRCVPSQLNGLLKVDLARLHHRRRQPGTRRARHAP